MALYWKYETSGALQPVIIKFLEHTPLLESEFYILKGYILQWVLDPAINFPKELIQELTEIQTQKELDLFIMTELYPVGIDPF